jgi:hypothetical protein
VLDWLARVLLLRSSLRAVHGLLAALWSGRSRAHSRRPYMTGSARRPAGEWQRTKEGALQPSPARLLDPRREVVGFVGRQGELAELAAWCQDGHGRRLRLVTGPGGVGKTRLAVELADRMRAAGWRPDRIAHDSEAEAMGVLWAVTRDRATTAR